MQMHMNKSCKLDKISHIEQSVSEAVPKNETKMIQSLNMTHTFPGVTLDSPNFNQRNNRFLSN